mmetsp:Transcript_18711/g.51222  ORF Transcript_18711/g.51222 Transcript_18711/m.51222 type:complete len:429 (-) Transcript_18711:58-1344(-)
MDPIDLCLSSDDDGHPNDDSDQVVLVRIRGTTTATTTTTTVSNHGPPSTSRGEHRKRRRQDDSGRRSRHTKTRYDDEVQVLGTTAAAAAFSSSSITSRVTLDDDDDDDEVQVLPAASMTSRWETKPQLTIDDDGEVQILPSAKAMKTCASSLLKSDRSNDDPEEGVEILKSPPPLKTDFSISHHHARKQKHFTCLICQEEQVVVSQGYSLDACGHKFCVECLQAMVDNFVATASKSTTQLTCPAQDCDHNLTLNDYQYIYRDNPQGWKAFTERANLSLLEQEIATNNGQTRRCPAERCNYTFCMTMPPASGTVWGTEFHCPACHAGFCLNCPANQGLVGPLHPGLDCQQRLEQLERQADERRKLEQWKEENSKADARFQQLLKREAKKGQTKPCPNCETLVTKNGGCNHMTCSQCRHEYWWTTGKPYP